MKKAITSGWISKQQHLKFLVLVLLLTGIHLGTFAQVIVGTGTSTQRYPLSYYYGYGRFAAIYTSSEINTTVSGGTIATLAWNSSIASSIVGPTVIYIKAVGSTTAVAPDTWDNTILGATQVYAGTPASWVTGWNTIDITDFPIAAGQNVEVLVECNFTGTGNGGSGSTSFTYTSAGSSNFAYWEQDNTAPSGIPSAASSGGINANRPNITFGGLTPPTCFPGTGISVSAVTNATATLNWVAPASGTPVNYQWEVRTSGAPGSGGAVSSGSVPAPALTTTITGLSVATAYTVYMRTDCGGGGFSSWTTGTVFYTQPVNNECANATSVAVNPTETCTATVPGTVAGATASTGPASTCGTYDDDVWFSFVPTGTSHLVSLQNVAGSTTDLTFQVVNACGAAANIVVCSDPESSLLTGLTPGSTYYLRVASYTPTPGQNTTFTVCISTPMMSYVSSTTTQASSSGTTAGSLNQQILQVAVVVTGLIAPLNLTQITFNTTGSTAPANITNAKVYYTGTSSTFATTTAYGSPVPSPNGSFNVTGSQVLTGGTSNTTNYFWLVYDINCTAPTANVVDAQCTSLTVGSPQTPTVTNPAGTRAITAASITATTSQPSTATVLSGSTDQQILQVALTGCATSPVTSITFSTTGSTSAADILNAKVYFTNSSTFATTTQFGATQVSPSGNFTVTGSQLLGGTTGYFWLTYDIAPAATAVNVVDGSCVSAVVNGTTATPATPNPTGTRAIVAAAVNDMPAGAITLGVDANCSATYSNVNSVLSTNEPRLSCKGSQTASAQVWFKFVAPASGFVKVSTDYASTALDTKVGLFSASDPNNLASYNIIACDDDGGVNGNSSAVYASGLTAGATYYVAVAHYNGTTTGAFCVDVKNVTSAMLAPTASCAAVQSIAGFLPGYTGWVSLIDATGMLVANIRQNSGTATDFAGSYTAVAGASRTDATGQPYLNRNYLITGSNAISANLRLYFSDAEVSSLGSPLATLGVSRVAGSTCISDFAGTATAISQASSGSVNGISWVELVTPGFSNFFVMAGAIPLPVKLESFTGKNSGNSNLLNWTTAEEKNFSHFELQRSADGINFDKLGIVAAQGKTTGSKYSYTDDRPFDGKNLYRLYVLDKDGKGSLSDIVELYVKYGSGLSVNVHPNPVKQHLHITVSGKQDGKSHILLTDIVGKTIQYITLNGNTADLDMSNLPAGMYLIKYMDDSHSSITKVTKD